MVVGLPRFPQGKVAQVALGEFHGCCLTKDGTVWTWGKATKRGNMLGHDKEDGWVPVFLASAAPPPDALTTTRRVVCATPQVPVACPGP